MAVFEQRFEETFKQLAKGGITPKLWVEYHHMVDVMKVFIRTERLAWHNGHLSCIVTKMLHIFAAAGHHHYAKGARLYCQLLKDSKLCLLTKTPYNVSLPTLPVTQVMSGPAHGVTFALSRH